MTGPEQPYDSTVVGILNFSEQELAVFPRRALHVPDLRILRLSGNNITSLPAEIESLRGLQKLWLTGNALTELPPEIGKLTSLKSLWIANNRLTSLPPEIGNLTELEELWLDNNDIEYLPPEVGLMTKLQDLRVRNNRIRELPPSLAPLLLAGLAIRLEGNPLRESLSEVVSRGAKATAVFLGSLTDAIEHNEAKVLLVGEGKVGKSSVVAALSGKPFEPERSMTHGIEIHELLEPLPASNRTLTLRLWDFGGQEVYRVTHQFFFTRRSVYVLVWNPREGQEQNQVEAWLRRIQLRVGTAARVLVVATHGVQFPHPEIDFPKLRELFPDILVSHHVIDNETGQGIDELRRAIAVQAAELPAVGERLSKKWIAVSEHLNTIGAYEPQITYTAFESVCLRHGIPRAEHRALADLLHDLGRVIHYSDDHGLRDTIVLNPEWLTKAISRVLSDGVISEKKGLLEHRRLHSIWGAKRDGEKGYPGKYHPFFLRLMEKFDISFRLPEETQTSLIAQRVPYEKPALPWTSDSALEVGTRRLQVVFNLSSEPPGLVSWLTVRHHLTSTDTHWRSGVFLRHDRQAAEALIEAVTSTRLAIEVRAPYPDTFLNVLRSSFEDLVATRWPGLGYDVCVPCPTENCGHFFEFASLQKMFAKKLREVVCPKCIETSSVIGFLTAYSYDGVSVEDLLARIESKVDGVENSINGAQTQLAASIDLVSQVLKLTGTDIADCPRLFTVARIRQSLIGRLIPGTKRYEIRLWCEHPEAVHPLLGPDGVYELVEPGAWFTKVAPYASTILATLKMVLPATSVVVDGSGLTKYMEAASKQVEAMQSLFPGGRSADAIAEHSDVGEADLARPAEGAAWRIFRSTLFRLDQNQVFGGLRKVRGPSGDLFWVCAEHAGIYDPGMPTIPSVPRPREGTDSDVESAYESDSGRRTKHH